jgi:Protein of unknown function (DUF1257)
MSHFTRIKTKMTEKVYLLHALEDMGYPYEEGGAVGGYRNNRAAAEIKITTTSPGYDIGFVKSSDGYEVVADWWGVKGVSQKTFMEQLSQRYAYHLTRAKLEEQGFSLVNEAQQQDGRIHLVVRRMM